MPSQAYREWNTVRARELDEVEAAHAGVGGTGPGRRYATQQINRAYAVLLASQFQGFCRDLHSECVFRLTDSIAMMEVQDAVRADWTSNRQLNRGNANQGTIAGDFNRLGLKRLWERIDALSPRYSRCRSLLELLNRWRNAIAHQDFGDPAVLGGSVVLRLATVRRWRRACHLLARALDRIVRDHVQTATGVRPW